jgi:hypothetical protein
MLWRTSAACAAIMLSAGTAWAGDPAGTYDVKGSNPGSGTAYSGTVTVERTGQTFRVIWKIGSETYIGTGIGDENGLSVAYRLGNQTGVAVYAALGANWSGVWTYAGSRTIGGEAWSRR